jgi:NADPH-dependent ferric siderophore reductase
VLPTGDPKAEGAPKTIARDFTPRRYDAASNELEIQFALHGTGPASTWAEQAKPGDKLGVGGPRGSFLIPTGFDWFLMLGDPTAIPAISRRLEELPAGTPVTVMLLVDGPAEQFSLASAANVELHWLDRQANPQALEQAAAAFVAPPGEGYIWAAGEGGAMRAIHQHFVGQGGFPKGRIRAASYWKPGAEAVHETMGV